MAYDFKKLADVSKDDTVPENGNVLYEEDGEIKKAPIKQDEGKKIKYITGYFMASSATGEIIGQFCDVYDSNGNETSNEEDAVATCPIFFEGSNIPYIPNSSDYEHMKNAEIIKLYDEGYELRMCTSVAIMSSNDSNATINNNLAPNPLKDMWINKETYKGWTAVRPLLKAPYVYRGSDFVMSKEGETLVMMAAAQYLIFTDSELGIGLAEEYEIPLVNEDLL